MPEGATITESEISAEIGGEDIETLARSLEQGVDISFSPTFEETLADIIVAAPGIRRGILAASGGHPQSESSQEFPFYIIGQKSMEFGLDGKRKVTIGAVYMPPELENPAQGVSMNNIETGLSGQAIQNMEAELDRNGLEVQLDGHVHPDHFFDVQAGGAAMFSENNRQSGGESNDIAEITLDRVPLAQQTIEEDGEEIRPRNKGEVKSVLEYLAKKGAVVLNLPTQDLPYARFTVVYHTTNGLDVHRFYLDPQQPEGQAIRPIGQSFERPSELPLLSGNEITQMYQQRPSS